MPPSADASALFLVPAPFRWVRSLCSRSARALVSVRFLTEFSPPPSKNRPACPSSP